MKAIDPPNPIHRIDRDRFQRMIETGVISAGERVELIDGELRDLGPLGPAQVRCIDALRQRFAARLGERVLLRVQGPLVLNEHTQVYPDLAILRLGAPDHPLPTDALLLIEVAEAQLAMDLQIKLHLYAVAGVRRYWVVDIQGRRVFDYWDPDPARHHYRQLRSVADGTLAVPVAGIDVQVEFEDLFPV